MHGIVLPAKTADQLFEETRWIPYKRSAVCVVLKVNTRVGQRLLMSVPASILPWNRRRTPK